MKTQFAALLVARATGSLIQALLFVLLARHASVPLFGFVGLILGIGQFVGTVLDLGMSTFLARARARGEQAAVASGLLLNLIGTSLLAIVGGVLALSLSDPYAAPPTIVLLGLALAFEKNVETGMSLAIADGSRWTMPMSVLIRRVSNITVFLALLEARLDSISAFAIAYVIAGALGQLHLRIFLRRIGPLPTRAPLSEIVRSGMPFLINNVSAQARLLDSTALALVAPPLQVGLYAAASRLSNPLLMIPATMTTLLLPHATRKSPDQVRSLAIRLTIAIGSLYIPLAAAAFLAPTVLEILLGTRYADAAPTLAAAWLSLPGIALSSPLASLLQGMGRERHVATNGVGFALLLLFSVFAGAFLDGSTGVAIAIGLVYVVKCVHLVALVFQGKGDVARKLRTPQT